MNKLDLTIIIVTYDRPGEIRKTINGLLCWLKCSSTITWHIADDNTPGTYIRDIIQDFPNLSFSATVTNRKGWGANVNKALKHCKTDYMFLCEDDYVARRPLNLDAGIALLEVRKNLGVIRYDGIAGHIGLRMELQEAVTKVGKLDYFEIDHQHSNHLNIYSNRPHLRHRRLHDTIGLYPENITLGETEEAYAHRVISREDCPKFAILSDGVERAFDHIGRSRQGTNHDPNWRPRQ